LGESCESEHRSTTTHLRGVKGHILLVKLTNYQL
jgi:hypothetical protein